MGQGAFEVTEVDPTEEAAAGSGYDSGTEGKHVTVVEDDIEIQYFTRLSSSSL